MVNAEVRFVADLDTDIQKAHKDICRQMGFFLVLKPLSESNQQRQLVSNFQIMPISVNKL